MWARRSLPQSMPPSMMSSLSPVSTSSSPTGKRIQGHADIRGAGGKSEGA
jgi:hypothetical protein